MDDQTAAMTPDERIAAGLCPECGATLAGHDATSHAGTHWPPMIIPTGFNQEAIRRQGLLFNYQPPAQTKAAPKTEAHTEAEHPSTSASGSQSSERKPQSSQKY